MPLLATCMTGLYIRLLRVVVLRDSLLWNQLRCKIGKHCRLIRSRSGGASQLFSRFEHIPLPAFSERNRGRCPIIPSITYKTNDHTLLRVRDAARL